MKRCFFIGHHDAPSQLFASLKDEIERHIEEYGVREFYVGHYGAFDSMAAKAIAVLKSDYPHIRLYMLLPYHTSVQTVFVPEFFDGAFYPFETAPIPKYAIIKANKFMIDYCDYLIAYVQYIGKARDFLEYARRRELRQELHIVNLGDE